MDGIQFERELKQAINSHVIEKEDLYFYLTRVSWFRKKHNGSKEYVIVNFGRIYKVLEKGEIKSEWRGMLSEKTFTMKNINSMLGYVFENYCRHLVTRLIFLRYFCNFLPLEDIIYLAREMKNRKEGIEYFLNMEKEDAVKLNHGVELMKVESLPRCLIVSVEKKKKIEDFIQE